LPYEIVHGIGKLGNESLVRDSQWRARFVRRGSAVRVGGLQDDLVTDEAALLELADDEVLQLGADLQQVEGEKEDPAAWVLEQHRSDFDRVENVGAGIGPARITRKPDRAVARRYVPMARSRNDVRQRSALSMAPMSLANSVPASKPEPGISSLVHGRAEY
jgi:hypothetical protein